MSTATKANPFASATKKTTAAKKDETPVYTDERLADALKQFAEAKKSIAIYDAQKKMAEGLIKQAGREKFLYLLQKEGRNVGSFKLTADGCEPVLFGVQDRYKMQDAGSAERINQVFPDTVETKTVYSFKEELLEKYMDQIAEAIMNADIPEDAKANLLVADEKYVVKKGTLDRLASYKEKAYLLFEAVEPIAFLK